MKKTMMLLAGGFGTRLAQVVADVPKPLAPVNGTPFLYYVLESFVQQGVNDYIFLLHHMAEKMVDFVVKEHESGILENCTVRFVREETPLGTGGSVANAVGELKLDSGFFVSNADTWLNAGIEELYNASETSIGVVKVKDVSRYGKVNLNGNSIQSFEEKTPNAGEGFINAGLYYFKPQVFAQIKETAFSMETFIFPKLVKEGKLFGKEINSDFIDIGIPEDYYRFCKWIESNKKEKL